MSTDNKLRLYPKDPHVEPVDRRLLQRTLADIDLLGREIEVVSEIAYRPGRRFFELVRFDPQPSTSRYTIGLPDVVEEIDFLGGSNVRDPHCACGTLADRHAVGEAWSQNGSAATLVCSGCGKTLRPWDLDWHHSNAFGRYTVDVRGVDLGEAVPATELFRALEGTNGVEWDYFYFVP